MRMDMTYRWMVSWVAVAAVVAGGLAGCSTGAGQSPAPAALADTGMTGIVKVDCAANDPQAVRFLLHDTSNKPGNLCYKGNGHMEITATRQALGNHTFVQEIQTGLKATAQWEGDGKKQPATPIQPNTVFPFPNHAGGVDITGIDLTAK